MDVTFEQLAQEAMQLAPAERAELADFLVGSLETSQLDDIQRLWIETAARRLSEIRSGRVKTIPGEDVIAEARGLVNR
jgi:putative addiction module component (TIGR02574 family)